MAWTLKALTSKTFAINGAMEQGTRFPIHYHSESYGSLPASALVLLHPRLRGQPARLHSDSIALRSASRPNLLIQVTRAALEPRLGGEGGTSRRVRDMFTFPPTSRSRHVPSMRRRSTSTLVARASIAYTPDGDRGPGHQAAVVVLVRPVARACKA